MARYVVARFGSGLLTLLFFVTLLFFLINVAVPGDFVTSLGPMTADQAAAAREQLGLDRSLPEQFFDWLGSVVTLDLGRSFSGDPVWDVIRDAMAPTMVVLGLGLLVAFTLGGWLGRTAGFSGSPWLSAPVTLVAIVCVTVFPPALAVALEQGYQRVGGWRGLGELAELDAMMWGASAPPFLSVTQVLWRMALVVAITAVALWALEGLVWRFARRRTPRWVFLIAMLAIPVLVWGRMGLVGHVVDLAGVLSLLILAVVVLTFGEVMLVTRAAMDDVMMEDYIMVARAKGLPERQVRDRHAARTALLPVLSRFTVAIPYFLTGLVILEVVFAGTQQSVGLPITGVLQRFAAPAGLGTVLFDAVSAQNTPVIAGALLVVGVLTVMLRTVLDVVHAALDPRIRLVGARDVG
jgi:peptide/nickel transport system permease protein